LTNVQTKVFKYFVGQKDLTRFKLKILSAKKAEIFSVSEVGKK